jgi:DNA ligase 1
MTFHELAQTFDSISKESSRLKMTHMVAALFSRATADEARHISYLALGTLRAPYEANQFNFAEKNTIKAIAQVLGIDSAEYERSVRHSGDLGLSIMAMEWSYEDTKLSIEQVYTRLSDIQAISGTGAQEEKSAMLVDLLHHVDALSASYIIRIIMGTMRLGFSDMTLIDSLSWMIVGDKSLRTVIEDAYNLCADSGLIAQILKQHGINGLVAIQPQVGIPIRPAAAERAASASAIIEKIGPCVAQPKLDGFRLQVHIDKRNSKPHIWFFSRNLLNMSGMFPDLTDALQDAPVSTVIMEGEAIVYDEETRSFVPFQETVKRKRKHGIEKLAQTMPLRLFLFDILYLNGHPVLQEPHEQRRRLLVNLFGDYPHGVVKVIEERWCENSVELTSYFNEQITRGLEGLVVKRPCAPYRPGKRNFNWIKFKRHEEGHLADTVDTVVLGYYAGKGKRAPFGIGAFLVGVYNKDKDRFETVAKVGTGLKDQEWKDLKARCDTYATEQQPKNVICAPELKPDVWVTPAIVVVILADEITQSPLHTAAQTDNNLGLALRFPRFIGYSVDKAAQQATSVHELRELYQLQFNS